MDSSTSRNSPVVLLAAGLVAGLIIATVDNHASGGEVSPIVVVVLLIAATAVAGALWGVRSWVAAFATWACVPLAHLFKHLLDLPDTLHPNTYASIVLLAAFTFVVATVGTGCGLLIRRLVIDEADR